MRRRFFVEHVRNGQAEITGDDAAHLTRVLRVEVGQRYEISDNVNVYLAEIESARKSEVVFKTIAKLPAPEAGAHLIVCAAIIKFDRFEWMIEKATELGVAEIIPVICMRTERDLDKAAFKRVERWRRLALEASQQSRRAHLPEIHDPWTFDQAVKLDCPHRFVLDEEPGGASFTRALATEHKLTAKVAILIGPEGGWTAEERQHFIHSAWTCVSMGPQILRAETAAIAALAVAANAWLLD